MSEKVVFDKSVIDQLVLVLGDDAKEIVLDLLQTYTGEAPGLIKGMKESIEKRDTDTSRRLAHTLKGSSANLGLVELAGDCAALEEAAKNGKLDDAGKLLEQIKSSYARALDALNGII